MKAAYRLGYSNKPDMQEALQKELEAFEPETYGQRFTLGSMLHSSMQPTARKYMREALEEAGDIYWPAAHATLARHLARTDNTAAEAEEHARISLRQRYSEAAHRALVRALSAQKKYPEAFEEAESFVEHFPHIDDAHMVQAQTLLAAKKFVLAAEAFERAHALERRNITAARQCVHAWLAVGRTEEAKKKLFEMEKDALYVLSIAPVHWGNYFLGAGQYGHALEWYNSEGAGDHEELVVEMNSGYCYFGMGDHEKARKTWEDHGGPLRDDPEYRLCIAMCDFADGNKEEAVRRYLEAKEDNPEFFTVENLRYHYLPPVCIDIFKKIEALAAEQEDTAAAE
jgi:tetratricopeptide (TPR) repeat protein